MAKRANPFLEDFVQQKKIHVGMKQFNNTRDRLQDVYNKTLQLLFNGAKKSFIHEATTVPSVNYPNVIPQKADRKLKQLSIGKNGALLHDTVVGQELQKYVEECPCMDRNEMGQCAYCERGLCSKCGIQCQQCQAHHCQQCCINGPDGQQMCVSCY